MSQRKSECRRSLVSATHTAHPAACSHRPRTPESNNQTSNKRNKKNPHHTDDVLCCVVLFLASTAVAENEMIYGQMCTKQWVSVSGVCFLVACAICVLGGRRTRAKSPVDTERAFSGRRPTIRAHLVVDNLRATCVAARIKRKKNTIKIEDKKKN